MFIDAIAQLGRLPFTSCDRQWKTSLNRGNVTFDIYHGNKCSNWKIFPQLPLDILTLSQWNTLPCKIVRVKFPNRGTDGIKDLSGLLNFLHLTKTIKTFLKFYCKNYNEI